MFFNKFLFEAGMKNKAIKLKNKIEKVKFNNI